jgi:protoheme IX farnesyltransferase
MTPHSTALTMDGVRRRTADFVALTKPRVVSMILITTWVGFYLGSHGATDYFLLLPTLIGTALAAGGTLALNQYVERDIDVLMERTRNRPLPDGRLQPVEALVFGVVTTAVGIGYLAVAVNPLSAAVTATITVTYLGLYTPMKRITPFCSIVGAIPGALPPVIGWAACGSIFGGRSRLVPLSFGLQYEYRRMGWSNRSSRCRCRDRHFHALIS